MCLSRPKLPAPPPPPPPPPDTPDLKLKKLQAPAGQEADQLNAMRSGIMQLMIPTKNAINIP